MIRKEWRRFWRKVDVGMPSECWEWKKGKTSGGYGVSTLDGQKQYAHRIAWKLIYDTIPNGMCILHRCDNPDCVNPSHLFLGTQADNMHDMIAKGRKVWASKLMAAQVLAIRESPLPQKELAETYGVDQSTISRIKHRKDWDWLEPERGDQNARTLPLCE